MAVSTHLINSTDPDCQMRVSRTAQSWRFVSMPSCLGIWKVPAWNIHGTPVPTQWEGRGWLDRTHEHMTPEHATDTNESETDTKSQTRICWSVRIFKHKLEMGIFVKDFFKLFFWLFFLLLAFLFIFRSFTFGQVKDNAHPPTKQAIKVFEFVTTLKVAISPEDGNVDVALIEESARDEGGYNIFMVDSRRDTEVTDVLRCDEQARKLKSGSKNLEEETTQESRRHCEDGQLKAADSFLTFMKWKLRTRTFVGRSNEKDAVEDSKNELSYVDSTPVAFLISHANCLVAVSLSLCTFTYWPHAPACSVFQRTEPSCEDRRPQQSATMTELPSFTSYKEEHELSRVSSDMRFDGTLMRRAIMTGIADDWTKLVKSDRLNAWTNARLQECNTEEKLT